LQDVARLIRSGLDRLDRSDAAQTNLRELEVKGFTVVSDVFTQPEIALLRSDYLKIKSRALHIMETSQPHERIFHENNAETRSKYWKAKGSIVLEAAAGSTCGKASMMGFSPRRRSQAIRRSEG